MATDDVTLRLRVTDRQSFRSDMAGAADDVRGVGDAADSAGSQGEGAFDLLSVAGVGAGVAIGAAFVAAGATVLSVIDDMSSASGRMQARLGLTAEEVAEFDQVAREVYGNNFGESMTEATDVVSALNQTLGLTGDELTNAAENTFAITDAFGDLGAEPQAISEAVRQMTAAWPGMTEAEALDRITDGFQNGLGASGDYLETLNEYAPLMGDIGISADQMGAAMEAGLENGARDTDYIADALKEFGIRMNTAGDTAQEQVRAMFPAGEAEDIITRFGQGGEAAQGAFQQIAEGLQGIDDPQARYTAAVELFGTKAEDLGPALMPMLDALAQGGDSVGAFADATDTLNAQYQGFGPFLQGAWRQVQVGLADALDPLIQRYGPALTDLAGRIGPMVGTTFAWIGEKLGQLSAFVGPFVAQWIAAWPGISAALMTAWGYVRPVIEQVGTSMQWVWDNILVPAFGFWRDQLWPGIQSAITAAWPFIRDTVTALGDMISDVWDNVLAPAWEFWVTRLWPDIEAAGIRGREALGPIFEAIGGWMSTANVSWAEFKDIVVGVWDNIKSAAERVWNYLRDYVIGPMQSAIDGVISAVSILPGIGAGGAGEALTNASSAFSPTVAAATTVASYTATATPIAQTAGRTTSGSSGDTFIINAVDAASFEDMLARNSAVVARQVRRANERNKVRG